MKYTFLNDFCFLFVINLACIVSGIGGIKNLVEFEKALSIFSKCQVNLHNYDGISFVIVTDTPLLVHTKVASRMELDNSIKSNLRLECTAIFHMVTEENRKLRENFFDLRKPERKWYEK